MPQPLYFMHVAKTGGTSLVAYLDRHFSVENSFFHALEGWQALNSLIASPEPFAFDRYSCVEAHAPHDLVERFSTKPVTITILRDPVDRLISHYEHNRRSQDEEPLSDAAKNMDILGYCKIAEQSSDPYNPAAAYLLGQPRVEPGTDVGHLLSKVDFVGTLPRLTDLCQLLAGAFGWRPPSLAPKVRSIGGRKVDPIGPDIRRPVRG